MTRLLFHLILQTIRKPGDRQVSRFPYSLPEARGRPRCLGRGAGRLARQAHQPEEGHAYLPFSRSGDAGEVKEAVADGRPVQPPALGEDVLRPAALVHEGRGLAVPGLRADGDAVVPGFPQGGQLPVGFVRRVRHPDEAADGLRLRQVPANQAGDLQQAARPQNEGVGPGEKDPAAASSSRESAWQGGRRMVPVKCVESSPFWICPSIARRAGKEKYSTFLQYPGPVKEFTISPLTNSAGRDRIDPQERDGGIETWNSPVKP